MNTINLSVRIISEIFWKIIFSEDELIKSSNSFIVIDDEISSSSVNIIFQKISEIILTDKFMVFINKILHF